MKKGRDQSLSDHLEAGLKPPGKKRGGLCGLSGLSGLAVTHETCRGHVLGHEGDVEQVKLWGWRGGEDLTSNVCQQPR